MWSRGTLRSTSALIMLAYVICHFGNHIVLLISIPAADVAHRFLIAPWKTVAGTTLLATAALAHYGNALYAISIRRTLRMPAWSWWQLGLGLCIPLILLLHAVDTRVNEDAFGVATDYASVLMRMWVLAPWRGILQVTLLTIVWTHASIGVHFWLRNTRWYARWRPALAIFALLWPVLALAGFVSAGNEMLRRAQVPGYVHGEIVAAHITPHAVAWADGLAVSLIVTHLGLVSLAFGGRVLRRWVERSRRPPRLTLADGRVIPVIPGGTVLESLNEQHVPHAQVCGGRARCTTCRVRVMRGLAELPPPAALEAAALARIDAPPEYRLACQIRPAADLTVVPLLSPGARPIEGASKTGFAGTEQLVTVMFIDLRNSTRISETRLPYDVLFLLDQFFAEMNAALGLAGGLFSQFTGDGLMALFGVDALDEGAAARAALRCAQEMKERLGRLNVRFRSELTEPLRMGIGIHFGEAIVGAIGPPGSRIVTAVGDTVNTAARLESLSKSHDDAIIVSRAAAAAAQLAPGNGTLHVATVTGRAEPIEYYAIAEVTEGAARVQEMEL